MTTHVIATAGHVDHGKSTLVRALTGIEPDRWEEERRRGLTIDLGFAWTTLPSGREISFVDVPGHERFLGNMLAGLGPAPVVLFVIAADEGWMPQSSDHRDAVAALGIEHGLIVVTRTDLASQAVPAVTERARAEFAGTGLADAPVIAVSAAQGEGLEELRAELDVLLSRLPAPGAHQRIRLWIDRSFSIPGAGTVVTGTLDQGTLRVGGELELAATGAGRSGSDTRNQSAQRDSATIRGLQTHNDSVEALGPVTRAAVNLRGVSTEQVGRGDALITPGAWTHAAVVDVRGRAGEVLDAMPSSLTVHVGTASVPVHLRSLGPEHARLVLDLPLPLAVGDRMLLRSTGERAVLGGVEVLDVDPPELSRRGDGRRRAAALAAMSSGGDVGAEVRRRGAVEESVLVTMGVVVPGQLPDGVLRLSAAPRDRTDRTSGGEPGDDPAGDAVLVDAARIQEWIRALAAAVEREHRADPLSRGLVGKAAVDALGLPDPETDGSAAGRRGSAGRAALFAEIVRGAGLMVEDGHVRSPEARLGLGPAEAAVQKLEAGWRTEPFRAPEAHELRDLGLGVRELAAAEQRGRLLRLGGQAGRGGAGAKGGTAGEGEGVVLGPKAPAQAMRLLVGLEQPFTTSQARTALGTTRRTVIPLLEHLDARGWTCRLDAGHREVVR